MLRWKLKNVDELTVDEMCPFAGCKASDARERVFSALRRLLASGPSMAYSSHQFSWWLATFPIGITCAVAKFLK